MSRPFNYRGEKRMDTHSYSGASAQNLQVNPPAHEKVVLNLFIILPAVG